MSGLLFKESRLFKYLMVLVILLFASCTKPPCECDFTSTHHLDVKIADQQGRNMVFGQARLFSPDSIRVLENDSDLSVHNAAVGRSSADTAALRLDFYVPVERNYIYYYQHLKVDTLDVVWHTKNGRCCGSPTTYHTIGGVKLNSVQLQPKNGIYLITK